MERLNSIALTFIRPQISLVNLMELYTTAGSATAVMDNRANLRDLVPDLSDEQCELFKDVDYALKRAEEEMEFCEKHKIQVLTPNDAAYPYRLKSCPDAPIALYYRGTADLNAPHIVCIIGTRKCTVYGQDLIHRFVKELKAECPDALIVSGLAYGVDIHAHRSALENEMETIGVVAHGLDMIYPSLHRETAKRMVGQGGLLTEYPKASRIDKRNFLQRNRIVAGLSDACILPESAIHGGGLVTCRLSVEYGREVFAFPGSVNAEYSAGCNKLIRNHQAQLITCARDFVESMGWQNDAILDEARKAGIELPLFPDLNLTPVEQQIVAALKANGDLHPDQIAAFSGLSINDVNSSLFMMEMNGIVRQLSGTIYHLV